MTREIGDRFTRYEKIAEEQELKRREQYQQASSSLSQMEHIGDSLMTAFAPEGEKDGMKSTGRIITNIHLAKENANRNKFHLNKKGDDVQSQIIRSIDICDSPIERAALPWLCYANYGEAFTTFPVPIFFHKEMGPFPTQDLFIVPQFAFVRYRADFAVVARKRQQTKIVAVECDGDNFHTAKSDTLRDGLFASFGIETIRASGSEITMHADQFAARVASAINDWALQL